MKSLILGLCLVAAAALAADKLTVDEIVTKANLAAYYAGDDGRANVVMKITDANGLVRTREFTILRLDEKDGGNQKFYVYFKGPAEVRRMAYLVWKHTAADKDDDRWLYLPENDLVRRIAPGDKRTRFVGSDFVYEDVSGRSLTEDRHELLEETDTHYVIKNIPLTPAAVEFAWYTVHIDKTTFLPVKAEYYDRNDKVFRTVEAVKIETIAGHPTVIESKVTDLTTGGHTVNTFSEIEYDIGLNDRIFVERFLRRQPREVR